MEMKKYKVICKACNTTHGYSETPTIENMSSKCSACGMDRIGIERNMNVMDSEMEFDLFINNKRNGASRLNGFRLGLNEVAGKNEDDLRMLFVERAAKALAELLKKPENCSVLLKKQEGIR